MAARHDTDKVVVLNRSASQALFGGNLRRTMLVPKQVYSYRGKTPFAHSASANEALRACRTESHGAVRRVFENRTAFKAETIRSRVVSGRRSFV